MVSKAEEREALKKIRAIVEKLGSDSYVATAFEGCFEIAEQNIDDDSALSYKGRCECLEDEIAEYKAELKKIESESEELVKEAKQFREAYEQAVKNREISVNNCYELNDRLYEAKAENGELKAEIVTLKNKIIELKAQLFDLMYGEGD